MASYYVKNISFTNNNTNTSYSKNEIPFLKLTIKKIKTTADIAIKLVLILPYTQFWQSSNQYKSSERNLGVC